MKKRSQKSFASFLGKAFAGGAVFGIAFALVVGMMVHAQGVDDGVAVNVGIGGAMVGNADAQPLIYRVFSAIAGEQIGDGTGALGIDTVGNVSFSPNGAQLVGDQGGSIELGAANGEAGIGSPYVDFHSSANGINSNDFDVRLINDVAAPNTLRLDGSFDVTGDLEVAGSITVDGQPLAGGVPGDLTWGGAADVTTGGNTKTCPTDSYVVGFAVSGVTMPDPESGREFSMNYSLTCRSVDNS